VASADSAVIRFYRVALSNFGQRKWEVYAGVLPDLGWLETKKDRQGTRALVRPG